MEQSTSRIQELLNWSRNSPSFMEPAGSLPYSKQPAICPYVEQIHPVHALLYYLFIIIYYCIQPSGQFGQQPEPSQATGMVLVRCILGKFLGVVCHCFPLLSL